MTRRCSHCGHNGHNSRTCAERGVRLFGVRLMDVAMRKSASMGNLNNYGSSSVQPASSDNSETAAQDGYVSDGLVQTSSNARERKKGVPWTEEEHRMFLVGLHKLGKGDWRGISRNYVQTRTPTQVASHAQKYFIRQNNLNKRKRRSSLFDIVSDPIQKSSMSEDPQKPSLMETSFSPPNCYPSSFMDAAQTSGGYSATPPYCQGAAMMRGGIPPPSAACQFQGSPMSFSLPSHQHFLSMAAAAAGASKAAAGGTNDAGEGGGKLSRSSEAPIRPAPQKPIPIPAPRRPSTSSAAASPVFSSPPMDPSRQGLGALGFAPVVHPAVLHSFPVLPWSHFSPMAAAAAEPQRTSSGFSPPQQETKICRPTAMLPFTPSEGKKDALSAPFLSWQESLGLSPPDSVPRGDRPSLPRKLLDRSPRASAFHASSAFSSSSSSAISAV